MLVGGNVEPLRRVGDDVAKPLVDAQVAVLDLVQDDLQHDHVPNGGILQEIDFVEEDVRVRHEVVGSGVHQRGVGQRRVVQGASRAALHATPHVVPQVVLPRSPRTLLGFLHQSFRCSTVVSYPDPNVRNDDYRLQYNITYRGSGQQVDRSCSGAPECWRSNQNREFA